MNKSFKYFDLFNLLPQPTKVTKQDFSSLGNTPAYSSDSKNNGRMGYVDYAPTFKVSPSSPVYLVFGDHTRTMNIVREDFCVMDNVKVLSPKIPMTDEVLLFITTVWEKNIPSLGYARHWSVAKNSNICLPVIESTDSKHRYTTADIDWQYMQEFITELEHKRIAELEQERIAELEAYLKATSLNDYELTKDEKKVISPLNKKFKSFPLSCSYVKRGKKFFVNDEGLFDVLLTKKKINANSIKFGGEHPYVARGEGNNGIRGYINFDESFLNPPNTIAFGQDTATLNYLKDPYFTGDKILIFSLNSKHGVLTEKLALYLIASVKKAFSGFKWGQQSFAIENIANIGISLPIRPDGSLDTEYMEQHIRAIEKLVIKDVVDSKDEYIKAAKKVVFK